MNANKPSGIKEDSGARIMSPTKTNVVGDLQGHPPPDTSLAVGEPLAISKPWSFKPGDDHPYEPQNLVPHNWTFSTESQPILTGLSTGYIPPFL
jgi:hypothetical protein